MPCSHYQLRAAYTRKVRCPNCGEWVADYSSAGTEAGGRVERGYTVVNPKADPRKRVVLG